MTRRHWLSLCAAVAAVAIAIPSPAARNETALKGDRKILHALNRLTFGPRPGDIEQVHTIGLDKWIDQQLHPERIKENALLLEKLQPLDSLRMDTRELVEHYPPPQMIVAAALGRIDLPSDPVLRARYERLAERYKTRIQKKQGEPVDPDEMKGVMRQGIGKLLRASPAERRAWLADNAPARLVALDLMEGKLFRAVYGHKQLEEVLTDFWYNHFNVHLDKGADKFLVTSYERDAIRPHVFAKFSELLRATAEHPAMLFYLDNWQSMDPNAANRLRLRKKGPRGLNENYARELLELHTLGVDGGYTQKDIQEVARCFTGWTIRDPRRGGGFQFIARLHDNGEKTVLGVKIPAGGGQEDGLKVLEILTKHPSTAQFVSRKLAQRFVADNPPAPLVNAMARTFRDTNGDLRQVMNTMLRHPDFWSDASYRAKIKTPFEMVVSALRATNADVQHGWSLAQQLDTLGQPLYRKQEPTGYSHLNSEWVNSAALLGRMNFALALTENRLPGVRVTADHLGPDLATTAHELLQTDLSAATRQSLTKALQDRGQTPTPATLAAYVLGSPEFQRR